MQYLTRRCHLPKNDARCFRHGRTVSDGAIGWIDGAATSNPLPRREGSAGRQKDRQHACLVGLNVNAYAALSRNRSISMSGTYAPSETSRHGSRLEVSAAPKAFYHSAKMVISITPAGS